jgi:DNA-binding transcriptional ArsR family regulator
LEGEKEGIRECFGRFIGSSIDTLSQICHILPHNEMAAAMQDIMDMLKALADERRIRILHALQGGELCVCQLIALLELAPSTVSKHLTILRSARLVDSRKEGRWMSYRLSKEFRPPSAGKVLAGLFRDMEKTPEIVEDRRHMKRICDEGLDVLCRRLFCKPRKIAGRNNT